MFNNIQKPEQSDLESLSRSSTNTPNAPNNTPYTLFSPKSSSSSSTFDNNSNSNSSLKHDEMSKEIKEFENIQIINVDTSSTKFSSWPPQIENIGLSDIHHKFLNECNTSNKKLISALQTRTIWMINSTAVGGGVAEMLPMLISMFSEINICIKWVVISPPKKYASSFFDLTKQIHNNIHGDFNPSTMSELNDSHRNILESVCYECYNEFISLVHAEDIIIIHDPQPLAMIKFIKQSHPQNLVVWRSHIGVDIDNAVTNKTWSFLKNYINLADHIIFTMKDYIPKFILNENRIPYSIIPPAICPFTEKNIGLSYYELSAILAHSNIIHNDDAADDNGKWSYLVQRVNGESGQLSECSNGENKNFELLFNPVLCEISRWDKLKGWIQLIESFVYLKQNMHQFIGNNDVDGYNEKYLKNMLLVLGGPDPKFIQDDPEGIKVFNDLCTFYKSLNHEIQKQIFILSLPMDNKQQNALIVNALQRLSNIVVQNSIKEGFGLTVTEAMYKGTPIIASHVGGIKSQVFDQMNGVIIDDPNDYKSVAKSIYCMISGGEKQMKKYAICAKENVINNFLIWSQCTNYLNMLKHHFL